jgi:hypothetical protein
MVQIEMMAKKDGKQCVSALGSPDILRSVAEYIQFVPFLVSGAKAPFSGLRNDGNNCFFKNLVKLPEYWLASSQRLLIVS